MPNAEGDANFGSSAVEDIDVAAVKTTTGAAGDRVIPAARDAARVAMRRIRLAAAAAIVAGALRVATSFWAPPDASLGRETLYLVIDVCILFGILGMYAVHRPVEAWGFIGFVLAVGGAASIVGPDGRIGDVDMYAAGALALGAGVVLFGASGWRAGTLPWWIPALFLTSLTFGIVAAATGAPGLFVVSGVSFGAALTGAGVRTWRAAGSRGHAARNGPSGVVG